MNLGIVHDIREGSGECPTDPGVAGIGVTLSRDGRRGVLTTIGRRVLCIGRSLDYPSSNRGCDLEWNPDSRHGIPAEKAEPIVQ